MMMMMTIIKHRHYSGFFHIQTSNAMTSLTFTVCSMYREPWCDKCPFHIICQHFTFRYHMAGLV